jgi:hypothetical protein
MPGVITLALSAAIVNTPAAGQAIIAQRRTVFLDALMPELTTSPEHIQ